MSRTHNETGCPACRRGTCWKQALKARTVKRAAKAMLARQVANDVEDHLDARYLDIIAAHMMDDDYDDASDYIERELEWQRFAANQNTTVRVPVMPRAA